MRRPWVGRTDAAVTAVFAGFVLLERHLFASDPVTAPLWLGLLSVAPLAVRRAHPRVALGAATALVLGPSLAGAFVPFFFAGQVPLYLLVYTVVRRHGDVVARSLWASGIVVAGVQALHVPHARSASYVLFDTLTFAVAWLVGRAVRRFDLQGRELQETLAALAREQQQHELLAVAAERNRLAAEAHDVVGQAVSVMVVQIGAARLALEKHGVPCAGLGEIEDLGRQALTELRRLLGVLHADGDQDPRCDVEVSP